MNLKIEMLNLGDVILDSSLVVLYHAPGNPVRVPTWGYLILGSDEGPILVDTGYRDPAQLEIMGMKGIVREGAGLENQLARHGIKYSDIRFIVHTHLHMDHAG